MSANIYMDEMFEDATSFNQDLSGWVVSSACDHYSDFDLGATLWTAGKPDFATQCPPPG